MLRNSESGFHTLRGTDGRYWRVWMAISCFESVGPSGGSRRIPASTNEVRIRCPNIADAKSLPIYAAVE